MEEQQEVSLKDIVIKYGVINGLIGIILFLIIDFAGGTENTILGYLPLLATAIIMFFAHKEYIREGDGYMNYSQGLGLGTLMVLVSAAISSVFTFIYISYVNTNYVSNMLKIQRQALEEQNMSDAQIDQAMEFTETLMNPVGILIMGIIGGVFTGFLVSLIVSAVTKISRPEFE